MKGQKRPKRKVKMECREELKLQIKSSSEKFRRLHSIIRSLSNILTLLFDRRIIVRRKTKTKMKMKKLTLLLFALACAMTTWAKGIDTLAVDLIYKELLANPKVTKTPLCDTLADGNKA